MLAVPKSLTQYYVFIGSPGGLDKERKLFSKTLEKFTRHHAERRGVTFHPVGWEDTIAGVGRPQALINEDLKECDYAVFVLHNRWGTPTGGGHSSGTEEEWELAEQLYEQTKIRNIALFFKEVAKSQLKDPGEQLKAVLAFKRRIENGKKYLFKSYAVPDDFSELLEAQLAEWLLDHERTVNAPSSDSLIIGPPTMPAGVAPTDATPVSPSFDYWIAEADRLMGAETPDYSGALFCADKALAMASSDIEWARAKELLGGAQFYLNNQNESIAIFAEIVERFGSATDSDGHGWTARALFNRGVALGQLGRREEEIAAYDDLVARFGFASEVTVREEAARALFNKGARLGELGRYEEELAVYDDVLARFGAASELSLREQIAKALVNKGYRLGQLGRSEKAVAVYDDILDRFGAASELSLREQIAKALVNKCTSSEPFGQVSNRFKRGSGPSGLRLRLQLSSAAGDVGRGSAA